MPKWRLKKMGYLKSVDELGQEFRRELSSIVEDRILETTPKGVGILRFADHKHTYGQLIYVEEKIKLIEKWEKSGRKTSFLSESPGELIRQKYEILNKLPAEASLKWMWPDLDIEAIKAQHQQP